MALKVYTSGNYIITDTGTVMHEFAKGYTTYSYNQTSQTFTIRESVGGSFTITRTQLLAGDIVNESSVAYTFSTFETFLRENTGFKTAPGGSGATPIGATLLKTGQTVSYRTGDDGDIEAGRSVDFFTLSANNPFNNTNRFTDELGGQTYTNNIVIDWSTYDGSSVLGWDRRVNGGNADIGRDWDQCIDEALAHSVGGFSSGWRLGNDHEFFSLVNRATAGLGTSALSYTPINLPAAYNFHTSTTVYSVSSQSFSLQTSVGTIVNVAKTTNTFRWMACRTFTVSGTTLS